MNFDAEPTVGRLESLVEARSKLILRRIYVKSFRFDVRFNKPRRGEGIIFYQRKKQPFENNTVSLLKITIAVLRSRKNHEKGPKVVHSCS